MRLGLQHALQPEALQVHVGDPRDPGDPETLRWVNSGGDGTGA